MKDVQETCRIAVIQAEPVMFDKAGGLKKALRCIRNAAAEEAELIVFPELFIPGYPIGMNFGFSMGKRTEAGRADWKRYYDASLVGIQTAVGCGQRCQSLCEHGLFGAGRDKRHAL